LALNLKRKCAAPGHLRWRVKSEKANQNLDEEAFLAAEFASLLMSEETPALAAESNIA